MNYASAWRVEFARSRIVPAYAASQNVGAVFVAGSVARDLADQFSDVELHVFWKSPPSYDEREAIAEAAGGSIEVRGDRLPSESEHHRLIAATSGSVGYAFPREAEEWSDLYFVDGVYLDVSGFLCEQIESYLEGLAQLRDRPLLISDSAHSLNPLIGTDGGINGEIAEMLIAAIEDGHLVHGEDVASNWRARCHPYPDELAVAVVQRNLKVEKDWWAIDQLVAREERLLVYEVLATLQRKLMRILLGLNRIYLTDVRLKWIGPLCDKMTIVPSNLPQRFRTLYEADLASAAAQMEAICEEVWDLVDRELSQVDSALRDRWFRYRRPAPDGPPFTR